MSVRDVINLVKSTSDFKKVLTEAAAKETRQHVAKKYLTCSRLDDDMKSAVLYVLEDLHQSELQNSDTVNDLLEEMGTCAYGPIFEANGVTYILVGKFYVEQNYMVMAKRMGSNVVDALFPDTKVERIF